MLGCSDCNVKSEMLITSLLIEVVVIFKILTANIMISSATIIHLDSYGHMSYKAV